MALHNFSSWTSLEEMLKSWDTNPCIYKFTPVSWDDVLFAYYNYEDYSGSAFVVFMLNGLLFEVHGSHCSCYGLEDQWAPEETSWEALRMFQHFHYNDGEDSEPKKVWEALVASKFTIQ